MLRSLLGRPLAPARRLDRPALPASPGDSSVPGVGKAALADRLHVVRDPAQRLVAGLAEGQSVYLTGDQADHQRRADLDTVLAMKDPKVFAEAVMLVVSYRTKVKVGIF